MHAVFLLDTEGYCKSLLECMEAFFAACDFDGDKGMTLVEANDCKV